MALWKPDPTFNPSPRDAAAAPPERLAYVGAFDRTAERTDAIAAHRWSKSAAPDVVCT